MEKCTTFKCSSSRFFFSIISLASPQCDGELLIIECQLFALQLDMPSTSRAVYLIIKLEAYRVSVSALHFLSRMGSTQANQVMSQSIPPSVISFRLPL